MSGLSFQSLLHSKYIENHSPIYWAIVNSKSGPASLRVLEYLLARYDSKAGEQETIRACMVISDGALFQRVHQQPCPKAEKVLRGDRPMDIVKVLREDSLQPSVRWTVHLVLERLDVVGAVAIDVLLNGTIWSISLVQTRIPLCYDGKPVKKGSWILCTSILEPSPRSHFRADFTITPLSPETDLYSDKEGSSTTKPLEFTVETIQEAPPVPKTPWFTAWYGQVDLGLWCTGELGRLQSFLTVADELKYRPKPYIAEDGSMEIVFTPSLTTGPRNEGK